MLQPIPQRELDKIELVPQAVIGKPVSYFRDALGIKFVENHDDLDDYEGAALSLNGTLPLALRHYRGHPPDTTTIYLSRTLRNIEEISKVVRKIVEDLKLSPNAINWQRADDPSL